MRRLAMVLSLLAIVAMVLAACPAPTAAPAGDTTAPAADTAAPAGGCTDTIGCHRLEWPQRHWRLSWLEVV